MTLAAAVPTTADPTHDENRAAVHAQRVVRGFLGRLAAVRQANLIYEKIFDPRTQGYYYYNTKTFETTWNPPAVLTRILGELGDLDTVAPTYGEDEAAVMIQTAWRRRRAIRTVRTLLASVVTKVLDESSGAHYYFNSLTGETSWSRPALFGSEDIEDYFSPMGGESTSQGQGRTDYPFDTGSYGYEQPTDQHGHEEWTQQEQHQYAEYGGGGGGAGEGEGGASTTVYPGYEGWVWDESSGWYYDEALAAAQLAGSDAEIINNTVDGTAGSLASGAEGSEKSNESDTSSDSGSSSGSSDVIGSGGGAKKRRRNRRRRSLAPRNYPRSKAQRLVDEAEDSVAGARPALLDLSELDMDRVTSRVYELDWLERLDLSSNRLLRISPDLAGMDNLVDLDLRHNRIRTIPNELEALTKLKHLRLGYNRISGFRGNIYLMSSLQTLDLGHNRLKEVPLQIGDLQLLKRTREWEIGLRLLKELLTLDVSYNLLEKWPAQVEECAKLQSLHLDHNRLREVPEVIGDNTALTALDLNGNAIKRLPSTINSLSSLVRLDLSQNELDANPILPVGRKEPGPRLVSLQVLRLDGNRLEVGPAAVETLKTLTELDVSHNPIINWKLTASGFRKMRHLRLKGVRLDECPEGLGQLDKLETLDLSENRIDTLDPGAAKLFKLKKLDLRGNSIKDLGLHVGNMMSLVSLDAGCNGLERIPPELSRCTALERLDLSGGKVETLPDAFSKLTGLRYLRANDNHLRQVSPAFASLTALEDLRLDGNLLTCLPDSLQGLTKMRYADLSRNRIESAPAVTRHWPLLTHLVLSRNPLRGRHRESRRLLQAAQLGHEAMHRGSWEEAVRHLNVAADAYDDVVHVVPDFPDVGGRGPPLAQTRPHDMSTFHHCNLGVAHLGRAREVAAEVERMETTGMSTRSRQKSLGLGEGVGPSVGSGGSATEDSSALSIATTQREEIRQKELELMSTRETRDHHLQAANEAFSYADHLEQLSRPVGRTAEVWLGRAAVSADMKNPAAALHDLERALVQLRGNAKVRSLLAKSRMELGQYERGLTDCRVVLRLLKQQEHLLGEREAEQERHDKEAAASAASAAASAASKRKAEERLAARKRAAAEVQEKAEAEANAAAAATAKSTVVVEGEEAEQTAAEASAAASFPERSSPSEATPTPADKEETSTAGDERGEEGRVIVNATAEKENPDLAEPTAPAGAGVGAVTEEESQKPQKSTDVTRDESKNGGNRTPKKEEEKAKAKSGSAGARDPNSSENVPRLLSPPIGSEEVAPGGNVVESAASEERWDWAGAGDGGALKGVNAEGKKKEKNISHERMELVKQRQDVAALIVQGEEGIAFVKQSIDMADILRGFVITPHGVPVKDVDRELLLQGRSTYRDRHRRLMTMEAAKNRARKRDAALMDRAFRQVTARQRASRLVKARKAAAMATYRDVEEEWERKQEEIATTKRTNAAKKEVEREARANAATVSPSSEDQIVDFSPETTTAEQQQQQQQQPPAVVAPKEGASSSLKESTAAAAASKSAVVTKKANKAKEQDEEEEEEEDQELQIILGGRAGRRGGGRGEAKKSAATAAAAAGATTAKISKSRGGRVGVARSRGGSGRGQGGGGRTGTGDSSSGRRK